MMMYDAILYLVGMVTVLQHFFRQAGGRGRGMSMARGGRGEEAVNGRTIRGKYVFLC